MAYITGETVIDIPPVSRGIPGNPLLGYNKGRTATVSTPTSTASATQSTLSHQLLFRDQRCAVTGAASNQLQACCLVNTIRVRKSSTPKKREENAAAKRAVEHILTRQQFGVGEFFLDALPNCLTIEAQWHGDLDTYGSFCIVLPLDQIMDIFIHLTKSDEDWDERAKSNPKAKRNLNITKDPFVFRKYIILVLRPDIFLPRNRPIPIVMDREVQDIPLQGTEDSWVLYHFDTSTPRPFLKDGSGLELPEIEFKSLRAAEDLPSVFALLVNANSKLRDHPSASRNDDLSVYRAILQVTVSKIFHVPKEVQNQPLSIPSSPSGEDGPASGTPTQSIRGRDDRRGQGPMDLDPLSDGPVEGQSNSGAGFEEPGYDPEERDEKGDERGIEEDDGEEVYCEEEDDEDDEAPGTINGLTHAEMRIVMQRVSDGTISEWERADAAMLMLGMAGGNRRTQPLSPSIRR